MQVSTDEFQELVSDLGLEEQSKKSATATAEPTTSRCPAAAPT